MVMRQMLLQQVVQRVVAMVGVELAAGAHRGVAVLAGGQGAATPDPGELLTGPGELVACVLVTCHLQVACDSLSNLYLQYNSFHTVMPTPVMI
jgi:hypothetical protein